MSRSIPLGPMAIYLAIACFWVALSGCIFYNDKTDYVYQTGRAYVVFDTGEIFVYDIDPITGLLTARLEKASTEWGRRRSRTISRPTFTDIPGRITPPQTRPSISLPRPAGGGSVIATC